MRGARWIQDTGGFNVFANTPDGWPNVGHQMVKFTHCRWIGCLLLKLGREDVDVGSTVSFRFYERQGHGFTLGY